MLIVFAGKDHRHLRGSRWRHTRLRLLVISFTRSCYCVPEHHHNLSTII